MCLFLRSIKLIEFLFLVTTYGNSVKFSGNSGFKSVV